MSRVLRFLLDTDHLLLDGFVRPLTLATILALVHEEKVDKSLGDFLQGQFVDDLFAERIVLIFGPFVPFRDISLDPFESPMVLFINLFITIVAVLLQVLS